MKTRVKLFTHTDLDGVGCAILAKSAFKSFLDIDFCGYTNIDNKVMDFIRTGRVEDYVAVFITDISVNPQTAKTIDESYADKFILIDHHETANWLNKYGWAIVKEKEMKNEREVNASGTSLLFSFLYENELLIGKQYYHFVEMVRLYDSWDWTKTNSDLPKQLNDLFFLLGRFEFMHRFVNNPSIEFSELESKLLELEENKIKQYIKSKQDELIETNMETHLVGVVFLDRYHSEVGNSLAEKNKHLDFIVLVNPAKKQISFRGIRDDINLGEVAKNYGGGGHKKSAGCQFSNNVVQNFIKEILK